jgi:MFS transporter, DHA1 family, inner membrane transport protein
MQIPKLAANSIQPKARSMDAPATLSTPDSTARPARRPWALYALTIGAFGIGTTEFVIMGLLLQLAGDL